MVDQILHVSHGLPPDLVWVIQSDVEHCGIGRDTQMFYRCFNPEPSVYRSMDDLFNRAYQPKRPYNSYDSCRGSYISNELMKPYHRWWYKTASTEQRGVCLAQGVLGLIEAIPQLTEFHFPQFVSRALDKGWSLDNTGMHNYFTSREKFKHSRRVIGELMHKVSIFGTASLQHSIETYNEVMVKYSSSPVIPSSLLPKGNVGRTLIRNRQKALTRSTQMLERIAGPKEAHAFIKGDEIRVEGQCFNFSIKKGWLFTMAHGGLDIVVTDKLGNRLFDLCWYVDGVPAPDQLAALMLSVIAGDEEEILRVGNWFNEDKKAIESYEPLQPIYQAELASTNLRRVELDEEIERERAACSPDEWEGFTEGTLATIAQRPELEGQFKRRLCRELGDERLRRWIESDAGLSLAA